MVLGEAFNNIGVFPFFVMGQSSNTQRSTNLDNLVRLELLNISYITDPQRRPLIHAVKNNLPPNEYAISLNETGNQYKYTYTKPNSKSLEIVVGVITELMAFYDTFNPRSMAPTKPIEDKINLFLKKHTGANYSEFIKMIRFEDFNDGDYSSISNSGLKKKLFNYRAKLYLGALAVAEDSGFDVKTVLAEISQSKIYPIKKEINDRTFDYIAGRLAKR